MKVSNIDHENIDVLVKLFGSTWIKCRNGGRAQQPAFIISSCIRESSAEDYVPYRYESTELSFGVNDWKLLDSMLVKKRLRVVDRYSFFCCDDFSSCLLYTSDAADE